MKRTLPFLIAMVMAILGWLLVAPTSAGAVPERPCVTYTYDTPAYDAPGAGAVSERGPPASCDRGTTYEAVNHWSRGDSARPNDAAGPPATTYYYLATVVQIARPTTTTRSQVRATDGDLCALQRSLSATDTEGASVQLFRHAGPEELADLKSTGQFNLGSNSTGKYFAENAGDAAKWGEWLNGGQGGVVSTRVPQSFADQMMHWEKLDGIGPARFASPEQLDTLNRVMSGIEFH